MPPLVLIVDDNTTNRKLAADTLVYDGFSIEHAGNAAEALAVLSNTKPDLILMDISMPGMDGLELTRRLKANPSLMHIPVVALTASAMKGDDRKAFDAGCEGYITKPIDTRRFAAHVSSYIKQCKETHAPTP